ncbi:MAG TPA: hypothetical protein VIU11_21410 [Nakamurella sp.]
MTGYHRIYNSIYHRIIQLERCPRPACTGRAYPLTPSNAHTPGP